MNRELLQALLWFMGAVVFLLAAILWELGQFRKDYRNTNGLNQKDSL